jgi:ribosome-binding protein aMBF1 (putative translation factor)
MADQINNPDWAVTTMYKNGHKPSSSKTKSNGYVQSHQQKIEKQIDDDDYVAPIINTELKKQISVARQAKGWTQKQFATQCNIPLQIVQQYEQGKGVPDQKYLSKMSRILGTKLKK